MKLIDCVFGICCLLSCNKRVAPGTYIFKQKEKITIEPNGRYRYYSGGVGGRYTISSGIYDLNKEKDIVKFIADSGGFFKIKVHKVEMDSSLGEMKKIVINNSGKGKTTYKKDGGVYIQYDGTASVFVHETTHAYQFEMGKLFIFVMA